MSRNFAKRLAVKGALLYRESYQHLLWLGLLSVLLLLFIGINMAYLERYRSHGVLTFDEAAYVSTAMTYATALKLSIGQWLRALFSPLSYAPLLPIMTSLGLYVFGSTESVALNVTIGIGALLLILVYHFSSWLSGRAVGLLTVLAISVMNEVQASITSFMFASPTALFFVGALYAYLRSENFLKRGWSFLFGLSLACMVLSRTMAVAFLPAFALVGGFYLFYERSQWKIKWRHVGLAAGVFLAVALPWYVRNAAAIFGYLTSYGYGTHVAEYDPFGSPLSWIWLKSRLYYLIDNCGFLGVAIIILGLISDGVRRYVLLKKRPVDHALALCWSIAFLSEAILWSSRNAGSAFDLPVLIVLMIAAVTSLIQWIKPNAAKRIIALLLSALLLSVYVLQHPFVLFSMPYREAFRGPIAFLTSHIVATDFYFHYVDSFFPFKETTHIEHDLIQLTQQWRQFNETVALRLKKHNPDKHLMLYASRHVFFNVNTLALENAKHREKLWRESWPVIQVDPITLDHSVQGYQQWLASLEPNHNCFAIFLSDNRGDCAPFVTIPRFQKALRLAGYHEIDVLQTPMQGQHLSIWKKEAAYCVLNRAAEG